MTALNTPDLSLIQAGLNIRFKLFLLDAIKRDGVPMNVHLLEPQWFNAEPPAIIGRGPAWSHFAGIDNVSIVVMLGYLGDLTDMMAALGWSNQTRIIQGTSFCTSEATVTIVANSSNNDKCAVLLVGASFLMWSTEQRNTAIRAFADRYRTVYMFETDAVRIAASEGKVRSWKMT